MNIDINKSITLKPLSQKNLMAISLVINNETFRVESKDSYPFPNTSFPASDQYIKSYINSSIKKFESKSWTIEYGTYADNQFVWVFSYSQWSTERSRWNITIGYWIGIEHWWQWIVTQVILFMSDWIFDTIRYSHRIRANVSQGNIWSSKVLDKSGFINESLHKESISYQWKYLDEKIYTKLKEVDLSKTKKEWRNELFDK